MTEMVLCAITGSGTRAGTAAVVLSNPEMSLNRG